MLREGEKQRIDKDRKLNPQFYKQNIGWLFTMFNFWKEKDFNFALNLVVQYKQTAHILLMD